jgi:hypothetical protein
LPDLQDLQGGKTNKDKSRRCHPEERSDEESAVACGCQPAPNPRTAGDTPESAHLTATSLFVQMQEQVGGVLDRHNEAHGGGEKYYFAQTHARRDERKNGETTRQPESLRQPNVHGPFAAQQVRDCDDNKNHP